VEAAVNIKDLSGGKVDSPLGDGADGACDVLGLAPASRGGEALGDEGIILVLDGSGHVGSDDAGA